MCDKLLLTVVEASRSLSIGRSKTYQLLQKGRLKSIHLDGSRRVLVSDLVEFVRKLSEDSLEQGSLDE